MKDRDATIDIAKGIGIFLVAAGHSGAWASMGADWIGSAIFSFHMPLFFFLSGCFLPVEKALPSVAGRRAKGLLLPYLVVVPLYVLDHAEWNRLPEWLGRMAWGTGQAIAWPWTPNWFLTHLFLATLVAWGIARIWNRLRIPQWAWPFLLGCLLLVGRRILKWEDASSWELWDRKLGVLGLPWGIDILPFSLVFLLSAPLWRRHGTRWTSRLWSLPLLLAAASLLFWRFGWSVNLNMRTYDHLAGSTLQAILGILATLSLSSLLARTIRPATLLTSLGRASLWILMFHSWILCTFDGWLWPHNTQTPIRFQLVCFFCCWTIPWGLHALFELLRPRLLAWFAVRRSTKAIAA
jgi:fucose 4-O-acetylase-like acetyltransferase